jgi:hypothetical protein
MRDKLTLGRLACRKIGKTAQNKKSAKFGMTALAVLLLVLAADGLSRPGYAAPPAYLVLRRSEAPGPHGQPGHPDAAFLERRTGGYAYGYFGVPPRAHASRHFGFYRTYTQWSTW